VYEEIQDIMGYSFQDQRFLAEATAIGFQTPVRKKAERHEFLGDAVIELIARHGLLHYGLRGPLHRLLCVRNDITGNDFFDRRCAELGILEQYKTQFVRDIDPKEGADLLEALIGAAYVDSGYNIIAITTFIMKAIFPIGGRIVHGPRRDPYSEVELGYLGSSITRLAVRETLYRKSPDASARDMHFAHAHVIDAACLTSLAQKKYGDDWRIEVPWPEGTKPCDEVDLVANRFVIDLARDYLETRSIEKSRAVAKAITHDLLN